jgi:hypothetical protein
MTHLPPSISPEQPIFLYPFGLLRIAEHVSCHVAERRGAAQRRGVVVLALGKGRALRVSARIRTAIWSSRSANRTVSGVMGVGNAQSQIPSGRCSTVFESKRGGADAVWTPVRSVVRWGLQDR